MRKASNGPSEMIIQTDRDGELVEVKEIWSKKSGPEAR